MPATKKKISPPVMFLLVAEAEEEVMELEHNKK